MRGRAIRHGASALALVFVAFSSRIAVPSHRYVIVMVGVPTDFPPEKAMVTTARATGLNEKGKVVGDGQTENVHFGFLWDAGSTAILGDGFLAFKINEKEQVIGRKQQSTLVWEKGTLTELAPGQQSTVFGINNRGQVVACQHDTIGGFGFLWEPSGVTTLPVLYPLGINDEGIVVGRDAGLAVLWESGELIQLGTLASPVEKDSAAWDINIHRQAVGWSSSATGFRAVMWDKGRILDLGHLPWRNRASRANAINDEGEIVGAFDSIPDGGARALIWIQGKPFDLNDLIDQQSGWVLVEALDINNQGQVVGWGVRVGEGGDSQGGFF